MATIINASTSNLAMLGSVCVYWLRREDHTDMFSQGYIGVSKHVERRFNEHRTRNDNPILKRAIAKHGWDNLVKQILVVSDEGYCLDVESKLRPADKTGWNLTKGGGMPPINRWRKGLKMTPEEIALMSARMKGRPAWNKGVPITEATRAKLSVALTGRECWNKGVKTPQEVKAKQSLAKIGKPSPRKGAVLSLETKQKISDSHKGKTTITDEGREALRAAHQGRKHKTITCPHCKKVGGATSMPRWHFDNCKFKE